MNLNRSRNDILPLIHWQVVLLVASVSSQHINIIPNNFTGVCPNYRNETCLTLAELASNTSSLDQANITLNFLPGDHVLAQCITVNDAANLVLTGHACNTSQCETKIKCQGTSGFEFQNIETIDITGLGFSGCGGEETNGGALKISNVSSLSILNCRFIGNGVFGVRSSGGAVYIDTVFDASIHNSYFINNSAQCKDYYNFPESCNFALNGGGAIFISDSRIAVSSCRFEQNSAYTSGGAIASLRTTSLVVYTTFINNHVRGDTFGSAGAVYILDGDMSTSYSHYTKNGAMFGGAVYMDGSSFVSSSHDLYTYNSAYLEGGAVGGNTSSFDSDNNTYSNNSARGGGAISLKYSNISCVSSCFEMNRATAFGGGAMYLSNVHLSTSDSYFTNNKANIGGSIEFAKGNMSISGCSFSDNQAEYGSVLFVTNSSVCTVSCSYSNNRANQGGGVMTADSSSINSLSSNYTNNSAPNGGVFFLSHSSFQTSQSYYTNNTANHGGAIYCMCSELSHACTISSTGSYYMSNRAQAGGVIAALNYNIIVTESYYSYNYAIDGGAIKHQQGTVSISRTSCSNNNASSGGAISTSNSSISISDSCFTNNTAVTGAALYCDSTSLTTLHSNYSNNQADQGGAIAMGNGISATCCNSQFVNNNAFSKGGAISAESGNLIFTSCHFKNNQARHQGGAIFISAEGNLSSINSSYSNNTAGVLAGGGAIYINRGSVSISGSNYTGNHGGAIYMEKEGSMVSLDSCYVNNTGYYGGAMFINKGNVYSNRNQYLNNFARYGGAIFVDEGNVSCVNSSLKYNRADVGGAILARTNTIVSSLDCQYEYNEASISGGAISSVSGAINSSSTNYTNNYSGDLGGALFMLGGNVSSTDSKFVDNFAHRAGGAICALVSNIYSDSSYYGNNHAGEYGGAIHTDICKHTYKLSLIQPDFDDKQLLANTELICNVYYTTMPGIDSVKIELTRSSVFTNNTCGLVGGAIISIQVKVSFHGTVPAVVNNNVAIYGGGLALVGSTLSVHSPMEIQDNEATLSGGGIFSYLSDMKLNLQSSQEEVMSVIGNTASQIGGGVYAIDSYIEITRGIMHFENNVAIKGAAVSLEQKSKIHLLKERQETVAEYNMKLEFINNHAQYGGAVYVSDSSENISACERGVPGTDLALSSQECFVQTILLNITDTDDNTKTNYINVFFMNNTASVSGGAIFGGLLDRCVLNRSAELVTQFPEYQRSTGFDYIRATAQFAGLVDYDNLTLNYSPDKLINAITSTNVEGLISSEPFQVCFCLENVPNCSYDHPNVFTKKGELFRLSIVAVDQVGNPINTTVISSFVSNNGDLNVDQARQETSTHCTELEYNVYPKGDSSSSQIEIYAEGPCSDIGISKRILNVTFLPCTCPIGFQPIETESLCTCVCDPILRPAYIQNCSYADETVLRDSNAWIDYVNTTTEAGYLLYPDCPFDYCVNKPVNINLNIPNGSDVQCAFNRSGKLCGACKEDLSLMMGTSRCQECSNSFISLIIPFALAGIALVAFILILNVTVATGTIHGLIFYANILVASRSIFIPLDTPNILIIFISWINLDLGIETCFYNGMDSYAKVLLQLAFPTYIILITVTIIIISEYSIWFATLIGKKDPVATLCTLILLSYSKLIRTIIASLQFTYLNYPDGSSEIVWLYDANVPYFTPSHIPRFITAIVIIILGSVYTVLIFFGQWIQRCGNRRFLRWVNNPKYNEFIKQYHVPFNSKHRYWVGLLLLVRIFHYLVSAFVPDAAVLLSVICIVVGLVLLKQVNTVTAYKNWLLNTLEFSFLVNLVIFTAATYYVGDNGGNKIALATSSLGISFITFLGILVYHSYAYILKDTRFWGTIVQSLQRIVQVCKRHNQHVRVPLEEDQVSVDDDNEQDEQMIEMQPPYTDDNDTDSIDLPHHYDTPVIVPAVRYDQPREPDLDILDPITTDDYRQLNQPPAPRPRQVPTTTVIDIIRPNRL